ncbi:YlmC/YmxH family sporulation protein [Halobacillus halophilus]|nr:YlmC/YmxH family sporulation protein [Halobacillus halophilus]
MRLKSLAKKEVINVENGQKLGVLGRADLIFDPSTGKIQSIVIQNNGITGIGPARKELIIEWEQIKTIGADTILLKK